MKRDETTLDERIRELCTRAVGTEGPDLRVTMAELADAIKLWQKIKDANRRE